MKLQAACTAEQEKEIEKEEETISLIDEDALVVNQKSNWIGDSGATCHMFDQ